MSEIIRSFILIVTLLLTFTFLFQFLILDKTTLTNDLLQKYNTGEVNFFLAEYSKWQWLGYAVIPILLMLKIFVIAAVVYIAFYLSNFKIDFQKILNQIILAEVIFIIPIFFKIVYFGLFKTSYTLEEVRGFSPLSLKAIFNHNYLNDWEIYLTSNLNLFLIVHILFLSYLISRETGIKLNEGMSVLVKSYVPAYGLWLLATTFFLISNS